MTHVLQKHFEVAFLVKRKGLFSSFFRKLKLAEESEMKFSMEWENRKNKQSQPASFREAFRFGKMRGDGSINVSSKQ